MVNERNLTAILKEQPLAPQCEGVQIVYYYHCDLCQQAFLNSNDIYNVILVNSVYQ